MKIKKRVLLLLANTSHDKIKHSIVHSLGYHHVQTRKLDNGVHQHIYNRNSKVNTDDRNRAHHVFTKQHGFTHTKTPEGHQYTRAGTLINIKSGTGGSKLHLFHK